MPAIIAIYFLGVVISFLVILFHNLVLSRDKVYEIDGLIAIFSWCSVIALGLIILSILAKKETWKRKR